MRLLPLAALLFSFAAVAAADPVAGAPKELRTKLSDDVIAKAVRDALSETPDKVGKHDPDVLRAERSEKFGRTFDDAHVPSCLHSDGLKFEPPHIGPIGLGGILALPFVGMAALRGKCN